MRSYVPSNVSDDDIIPIASLRRSVGAAMDDDSNDTELLAVAAEIVAKVESETGVLLRAQTCTVTAQSPTAATLSLGLRYDCLSLPFFAESISVVSGSYWDGSDRVDFDDGAVEVISGPRLRWLRPDIVEEREDCYEFVIEVAAPDITRYLSTLCQAVAWSYLRTDHPDFTEKLNGILSAFRRGL